MRVAKIAIYANSFEAQLSSKLDDLFASSGFVMEQSPPGYYEIKTKIDREKAAGFIEMLNGEWTQVSCIHTNNEYYADDSLDRAQRAADYIMRVMG